MTAWWCLLFLHHTIFYSKFLEQAPKIWSLACLRGNTLLFTLLPCAVLPFVVLLWSLCLFALFTWVSCMSKNAKVVSALPLLCEHTDSNGNDKLGLLWAWLKWFSRLFSTLFSSSLLQDQALPARKIPVRIKASVISNGKDSLVIAPWLHILEASVMTVSRIFHWIGELWVLTNGRTGNTWLVLLSIEI